MTATTGFERDNQGAYIRKDPQAVLDYQLDYSNYLASGDHISTSTVTVDSGITLDSNSLHSNGKLVTINLSGGTAGTVYTVKNTIVTNDNRTAVKRFRVKVEEDFL